MGSLASALLNNTSSAVQSLSGTSGTSASSSLSDSADTSSTSSSSATISANDFLTLLVTEMKNQDPTASTDPNEYINQLISVNSLEQLISINETLTNSLSTTSTSASSGSSQTATDLSSTDSADSSSTTDKGTANKLQSVASTAKLATGNLSTPEVNPAASTIAHALDGHTHTGALAGGSFGVQ